MSAAVSHELNQPLAAMKTYLAGARLLLTRRRPEEALSSFQRIDDLIDRMGGITRQLKSYARKGDVDSEPVDLRDSVLVAPFAGIVTVKAAQEGEMVSPMSAGGGFTRTGIGTIVDMSSLEVEVDVSENFIHRVTTQQPATITLNAYPDWSIPARVIAIIPTADRAKATVKVRVGFEVGDPRILPEMGARVAFHDSQEPRGSTPASSAAQQPVLVPKESVQADGDTGVVFVVADGGVERRTVRLGAQSAAGQVVLAGLKAGTRLARGDLSSLSDGSRVRVEE